MTSGLYVSCGFNSNGMALAPAAGRYIAEWIVDGAPGADVAKLDVRRFSAPQSDEKYLRERVTEIPGYHCRLHEPDSDFTTARDVRRSPLHSLLAAAGARFNSVAAWETPVWFASGAYAATDDWLEAVAAEARASTTDVLVVDQSADVKIMIEDGAAFERLIATAPDPWPGNTLVRPLRGGFGEIEALVRELYCASGRLLLTSGPDQATRVLEWLRRVAKPAACAYSEVTDKYAMLELLGPKRCELLAELQLVQHGVAEDWHEDRSAAAVPGAHEDVLQESTLLIVPCELVERLWAHLMSVGEKFGVQVGGRFARESIRIARGMPRFGCEATPARFVHELTPGGRASPAPVVGSVPRTHRAGALMAFSSELPHAGFGGREAILLRGAIVGELTSRARLPGWPATLALGIVDPRAREEGGLEFVFDGRRWPLARRRSAWDEA